MPSASATLRSKLLVIPAGVALAGLAGCSTTQQEAARLQVNSARLRAAQLSVRVARGNSQLAVEQIALVGSGHGSAIVVELRNRSTHAVSDLPISVGVLGGRRRMYLNSDPGIDYFQTHVPVIAAHGSLTWVFTTGRSLAVARPFALVGAPSSVATGAPTSLPTVAIAAAGATGAAGAADRRAPRAPRRLELTIGNRSAVPQYQLPVYAVARRAGRYVAAGQGTIAHLGTGTSTELQMTLVGNPAHATLSLEAPPTIFR